VKPLYKEGNKESISNYRPISLLPSFSKILEKVIFNRLYQHCIDNNILSIHQYGFKLGSSMDKAIFNLINEIYHAFNKRETVGGIFCDL
jgi:sarcosine oxidase/L-pipecolate oxidase